MPSPARPSKSPARQRAAPTPGPGPGSPRKGATATRSSPSRGTPAASSPKPVSTPRRQTAAQAAEQGGERSRPSLWTGSLLLLLGVVILSAALVVQLGGPDKAGNSLRRVVQRQPAARAGVPQQPTLPAPSKTDLTRALREEFAAKRREANARGRSGAHTYRTGLHVRLPDKKKPDAVTAPRREAWRTKMGRAIKGVGKGAKRAWGEVSGNFKEALVDAKNNIVARGRTIKSP